MKEEDKSSPVYKYFDSMMTCARVRPINSMPPPQVHSLLRFITNRSETISLSVCVLFISLFVCILV